jgi:hypothetical protein
MKKIVAAAIVAAGTLLATGASAAPAGGLGNLPAVAPDSAIARVHGIHQSCQLGGAGWHRSPYPGVRVACRPPRPYGDYWMWRCYGGRCGYWHRHKKHWH